jgi:hypothetical protein
VVRPTDDLEPYLRRHRRAFENEIVRLGCGQVPVPSVEYPGWVGRVCRVGTPVFVVAILTALLFGLLGSVRPGLDHVTVPVFLACWAVGAVTMVGMLLALWLSYQLGSTRVRLGGLRTFGELAEAVVRSRWGLSPGGAE